MNLRSGWQKASVIVSLAVILWCFNGYGNGIRPNADPVKCSELNADLRNCVPSEDKFTVVQTVHIDGNNVVALTCAPQDIDEDGIDDLLIHKPTGQRLKAKYQLRGRKLAFDETPPTGVYDVRFFCKQIH